MIELIFNKVRLESLQENFANMAKLIQSILIVNSFYLHSQAYYLFKGKIFAKIIENSLENLWLYKEVPVNSSIQPNN